MSSENRAPQASPANRDDLIVEPCPCPPFLKPDREATLRKFMKLGEKSVQLYKSLLMLMFEEKTTQPMITHVCYHLEVASWSLDAARHQVMRCVQDTRRLWEKERPDQTANRKV